MKLPDIREFYLTTTCKAVYQTLLPLFESDKWEWSGYARLNNDCAGADPELSEFQHKEEIALFLLKAKEVRKLSQTALDGIIFDFTELHQQIINLLKVQAKSCLEGNGLSMDSICGFEEVFDNPDSCTPFRQLDSKSLQETFY